MEFRKDYLFDVDTMKALLGLLSLALFIWSIVCLCSDLDASKGVGLMLGVLAVQNWKRALQ